MTDKDKIIVGEVKGKFRLPSFIHKGLAKFGSHKGARLFLLIVIIGLLLGGVYGTYNYHKNKIGMACTGNTEILQEAAKSLDPSSVLELGKVVTKIQSIKNYDQDPNCLNVLMHHYINQSDYQNAKATMEKLEQVYDPNRGFSPLLQGFYGKDMSRLRTDVARLKQQDELFKKNIRPGPTVQ